MFQASIQLYRNAYSGVSRAMWWQALVMLVNRSGTMVIPFLTVYLTSKGYSLAQAGYIMTFFGAGAVLGGFLGGQLTDRVGFFSVQIASLLLTGLLFLLLGAMNSFWQISLCVFIASVVGEAFRPANAAAISAYSTDATRTRSYSLNRLAINLGWSVGPAVGGALAGISYTLLFWVDGITCLLAALVLYFSLGKQHKKSGTPGKKMVALEGTISAYKDPVFLKAMLSLFFVAVCFFQLFNMVPVFYKEQIHLREATIGWVMAINGIIIVLVEMVLVYKMEGKNSLGQIVRACLFIGSSFLVLPIAPVLSIAVLGIILVTFGEMFLFPFTNKFWLGRSTIHNRGQYAAAYTMTFGLAQIVSPTLASQVAGKFGFSVLWLVDFLLCLIGALGFYLLLKNSNERI